MVANAVTNIPDFDANGNLPPGVFRVSLKDIEDRFTCNRTRRRLFNGLKRALAILAAAGVRRVWVNGSFVTAQGHPNDIDGCWEYRPSVDVDKLDPVFLATDPPRAAMKREYGVDFSIAGTRLIDAGGQTVQEFFQVDKNGNRRGILLVEIGQEP